MPVRRYTLNDMPRGLDLRRSFAFNRRPGARNNRGRVPATAPSASAPSTPVTIMGANCIAWWRADLGNTIATDGNWVDQVGGLVLAQGVAGSRPAQSASGGPNSTASMTFDGVDDALTVSLVRAAPGTTPHVIWFIFRQDSWTLNEQLFSDGNASVAFRVIQSATTPALRIGDGGTDAANNTAAAIASWFRGQAYFSNSTSDELLIGPTAVNPAASVGNNAGTVFQVGRNLGGTTFSNFSLCEVGLFNVKPSAGQKTSLDNYTSGRYGAGLT